MDATQARKYSTRRRAIVQALADALQQINGAAPFRTSVQNIAVSYTHLTLPTIYSV